MSTTGTHNRIDWQAERDRIDLAAVVRGLLGPESKRQGRRLLWVCPLHDDHSPSLVVDPDRRRWNCYPCGIGGDAATLVMRIENVSFPEAINRLTGRSAPSGTTRPRPSPKARPEPKPPAGPSGMPLAAALALVVESEARLWTPEGVEALAYLTGERRLTLGTIRAARLGWTPRADRVAWTPPGIVLPWFDRDRLSMVKVRPPDEWRESFPKDHRPPKYIEAFRDRPSLYPDRRTIRPGRPLVIVEGELDALLLGQELDALAAVVTLGGTGSTDPEPSILGTMLAAATWFLATDADDAGDRAAARWEGTRAIRVRPPEPFKDWTEARQGGIDLRLWWCDRLGVAWTPYRWDHLAGVRWGPARAVEPPDLIVDEPDPARRRLALESLVGTWPKSSAEPFAATSDT